MRPNDSGSSGDEDGDAEWKARIQSVAGMGHLLSAQNGVLGPKVSGSGKAEDEGVQQNAESSGLKLYQIKARKLLDDMLSENIVMVKTSETSPVETAQPHDTGVRLFRRAPPGIIFDPLDLRPKPTKRPRIVPQEEINEKSKKFRHQIRRVAVEGVDIMASAEAMSRRALERFKAIDAAAKAKAKQEDERVAELKKNRGEKWPPSISKKNAGMRGKFGKHGAASMRFVRPLVVCSFTQHGSTTGRLTKTFARIGDFVEWFLKVL